MIYCRLDLNNLYDHGRIARLQVSGVGQFPVFTGNGAYINHPECSMLPNAAIPPGDYWIVDRPKGGIKSDLTQMGKSIYTGNNYNQWFGLYRKDATLDDYMKFQRSGVTWQRGNFRMHPLRPDGTGLSDGCITFYHQADFATVRRALLMTRNMVVLSTGTVAYGEVTVIGQLDEACTLQEPE